MMNQINQTNQINEIQNMIKQGLPLPETPDKGFFL